jgi:hypothetical protein
MGILFAHAPYSETAKLTLADPDVQLVGNSADFASGNVKRLCNGKGAGTSDPFLPGGGKQPFFNAGALFGGQYRGFFHGGF